MDRALTLALVKRYDGALKVLAQIESRWPEWSLPYLVNGILLKKQLKPAEARQMLDMAISLGSGQADAYYYKALIITETDPKTDPKDIREAEDAISQAVALNPEDAVMRTLAGKVLLDGKDYKRAVEQLEMAVHLQPTLKFVPEQFFLAATAQNIKRLVRFFNTPTAAPTTATA